MKINTLLTFLVLSSLSKAQTTLAHWDLESQRVTPGPGTVTDPADPANQTLEACVNSGSLTVNGALGYSGAPGGSEVFGIATNGYNCFGFWEDSINTSKYIGFNISIAAGQEATLTNFNFDVFGYNDFTTNPSKIAIELYKNGAKVFENLDVAPAFTSNWQDVTVNFGTGANFQSWLGTSDSFEVRLYAHDITGTPRTRPQVALDNLRINGSCSSTAVPEPSTSLFFSFTGLMFLLRRTKIKS